MRPAVRDARRVVVKVGSSSLTTAEGGIDPARLAGLVDVLVGVRRRGAEVVLEAGDTLTFAPNVPHTFRSAYEEANTQVLWVFSPALPDHS